MRVLGNILTYRTERSWKKPMMTQLLMRNFPENNIRASRK